MTRLAPMAFLEVHLHQQDRTLDQARQVFLQAMHHKLASVLGEGAEAALQEDEATIALRREVEELEAQVAGTEAMVAACREEIRQLCVEKGVLLASPSGSPGAMPGQPSDALHFCTGETFLAPVQPITAIAVSASGRFLALAGGEEVVLCEVHCQSFRRVASCVPVPGAQVSWLSFFVPQACVDSSTLLVTAGGECLGWTPLEEERKESDPDSELSLQPPPERDLFLRFNVRGEATIVAAARGTAPAQGVLGARELFVLATDAAAVEVWDAGLHNGCTPMMMQRLVFTGGTSGGTSVIRAVALLEGASLMLTAVAERARGGAEDSAAIYVHEVKSGRCAAVLHPSGPLGPVLRLAYSEHARAWAMAMEDGSVEVFSSEELGPAVAYEDTLATRSSGHAAAGVAWPSAGDPSGTEIAWCGDTRLLLAVGSRLDAVLIYRYEPLRSRLVLQAALPTFSAGGRPVALVWAPELNAVVAAYAAEFQFWLLNTQVARKPVAPGGLPQSGADATGCREAVLERLGAKGPAALEDADIEEFEKAEEQEAEALDADVDEEDDGDSPPKRSLLFDPPVEDSEEDGTAYGAGGYWTGWEGEGWQWTRTSWTERS